jgi:hypothetical protein
MKGFTWNSIRELLWKSVGKIQIWLKLGKRIEPIYEDVSRFYCCRPNYIPTKALSPSETVSGYQDTWRSTNIMRTRHDVTLYAQCLSRSLITPSFHIIYRPNSSVSQTLWNRGPVNSFFIRRGPGPNKFTRKYVSNFFLSLYIKLT